MEQCPQYISPVCRCCLQNVGKMRPFYGFSLNEMFCSLTNLKATPNDGFPELLCFQCVLQLSRAYRFKEQCLKSYQVISKAIEEKQKQSNVHEIFGAENTLLVLHQYAMAEDSDSKDNSACLDQHSNELGAGQNAFESPTEDTSPNMGAKPSPHKCNICCKEFNSRKQMTRHLKTHSVHKPYKCSECGKTFAEKCNLKKHLYKHNGELRNATNTAYLCADCGKKFKYSSSLAKHMKFHTGKNLLHCSLCPKFFAEKSALMIHQRIHTGDRPYACPHCDRKFTQLCNLRKHIWSHNTERLFACPLCKRRFVKRDYLAVHMQTHTLEKQALCSSCGKIFANHKTLEAHMRVHDGKRPHECGFENCNKTFSRLDTAIIHRRIHSGEKPYSCLTCKQLFTTSSQLAVHRKSHSAEKSFSFQEKTPKHSYTKTFGQVQENEKTITVKEVALPPTGQTLGESALLFDIRQGNELSKTDSISLADTT